LNCEAAVSEVIGEMLMISMVLILVAVFAASFGQFVVPSDREPYVNVKMTADTDSITFWHKGGDWVAKSDISVLLLNGTGVNPTRVRIEPPDIAVQPETTAFDLNSTLTVAIPEGMQGEPLEVQLVTPRSVLFSGGVRNE
jgi:hypothetical protein